MNLERRIIVCRILANACNIPYYIYYTQLGKEAFHLNEGQKHPKGRGIIKIAKISTTEEIFYN